MIRRRASRVLVALAAVACVLFAQLAVAAHGCGDSTEIPALCQAHCDPDASSLDRPNVPPVAPPAAGPSAAQFVAPPLRPIPPVAPQLLARSTAPPLAIIFCCFRI